MAEFSKNKQEVEIIVNGINTNRMNAEAKHIDSEDIVKFEGCFEKQEYSLILPEITEFKLIKENSTFYLYNHIIKVGELKENYFDYTFYITNQSYKDYVYLFMPFISSIIFCNHQKKIRNMKTLKDFYDKWF